MKKYINLNGEIFESIIVANNKPLEDSMLNDNRRTGNSAGKRNLYLDKALTSNLIDYFPEIYNDYLSQKSENEKLVKVYFSVLNFVNNNDLVNEKKNAFSEQIISTTELLKNLKTFSNNKTHFFIEADLSNAGYHGVSLKKWKQNKEVLYDVLFTDTVFDLYVFKKDSECCFYCEFTQINFADQETELIEDNEVDESYPLTDQPLNQILYGPPGTGKTHNAINHALSIIKGNDLNGLSRKQIKTEFDAFVDSGQIQFVTFHQSYSYEEFVEGIKPTVNDKGDIEYHIVDGIFKKLCLKAENDSMLKIGDQFQNLKNGVFTISKYNSQIIEITREEGSIITLPTDLVIGLITLLDEGKIDISNIQNRGKDGVPLQDLLDIKYDKFIFGYDSILKALIEFITSKNRSINKNYVLIIDEINRGNISKIFGELITLIEDSKRIGSKESLRAKLTYSGTNSDEMFGVPNNVYIVGTMNTADRSIALIDTALRRRFTFFEYSADASLLEEDVEGINLKVLLSTINERIEFLLDKDHLIGHAFFINVENKNDLCSVFRNKIIPLLEEYFYGDYEKIQLVLGDNKEFGKKEENRIILAKPTSEQKKIFGKEVDGFEEKILYKINEKLVIEDFEAITSEFFTSIYSKS